MVFWDPNKNPKKQYSTDANYAYPAISPNLFFILIRGFKFDYVRGGNWV